MQLPGRKEGTNEAMTEDKKPAEAGEPIEDEQGMSETEIDLNLVGTFPASDPPSWTLGTDHLDESQDKKSGDKSKPD
jgi:hypothetical protein